MANMFSNLGRFVYANTSFLRVINRNLNYDARHRPAYLALKFVIGTNFIYDILACVDFEDWLAARRKENTLEARLDRRSGLILEASDFCGSIIRRVWYGVSERCESAEARLSMMEREIAAIKERQRHTRA